MLRYKVLRYGASLAVTNKAFSTQICSECKSTARPKGIADLGIRQWACSDCGALHDRDVNAARNLLVFAGAGTSPSRWRNPRP
ncbi:MAG: transposase [Bradyrhizobium sp.]|nr:transposase [Bradyrhizobium sp.]